MAIAGVADLVNAIREGTIPEEVAYGRIVELMVHSQKTVFGDQAQTAWRLFVFGAVITMDSGYGIDLKEELRAEILVVADHFCHWAELTYDKIRQGSARDNDTVVYHALDAELAAYARERLTLLSMGRQNTAMVMLGDTTIIARDSGMLGPHNGRPSVPDFESIKHENGLEKAVASVIKCAHKDGGHTKLHNLFKVMLGPTYMGQVSNLMLTPGGRDNFLGGFAAVPINCMPSQATVHMRKFLESLRSSNAEASWPKGMAVAQTVHPGGRAQVRGEPRERVRDLAGREVRDRLEGGADLRCGDQGAEGERRRRTCAAGRSVAGWLLSRAQQGDQRGV